MTTQIGIDTGGTFTDVVTADGTAFKVPSSRSDPARVIADAVASVDGRVELRHGTTVATNAVLEGKLARVGLIVNEGFRDVLTIGRQARPELYALEPRRPAIPTSRDLCAEVPGRLGPGGEELTAFDVDACVRAGRRLKRRGVEAIAVVLLHAYANPSHEEAALAALAPIGLPVTASSGLNPEFREVERGLCALFNAGLRPLVGRYLARLVDALGDDVRTTVMTSEGGLLAPGEVAEEPARLLVSGPAGGLVASQVWADAVGASPAMTLDMGGTSTDVAFLDGDVPRASALSIAGHTIRLPSLEIHTVGAGGGSLVRADRGGAMTVGPESAGADPGPAAYGIGEEITVTDANLLLGRIAPRFFAGGADRLDIARADRCARKLAKRLGLAPRRMLEGVVRLSDLVMTRALRVISLERGRDPRSAALVVFGGAGGLHGVALARALGVSRVVVPPRPGVLSAQGLLWASPARTLSRSVLERGLPSSTARRRLVRPLVERLRDGFVAEGYGKRSLIANVSLDVRYRGQSFELEVPEGDDPLAAFHRSHEQRYGFADLSRDVELVAVRVRVAVRTPAPMVARLSASRKSPTSVGRRSAPIGGKAAWPVFDRDALRAGQAVAGPALIADRTATVWVDDRARAVVHRTGALIVEVKP